MSGISTHVLDTRLGKPAAGLRVTLAVRDAQWQVVGRGVTGTDGRVTDLLPAGSLRKGVYRITFETGAYFQATGATGFYPEVSVSFDVADESDHFHVPLLLSPFGYSTYRGS